MPPSSLAREPDPGSPEPEDHARLLEATRAALKWLDDFEQHAPDSCHFGGEEKLRRQLRSAIGSRRA